MPASLPMAMASAYSIFPRETLHSRQFQADAPWYMLHLLQMQSAFFSAAGIPPYMHPLLRCIPLPEALHAPQCSLVILLFGANLFSVTPLKMPFSIT